MNTNRFNGRRGPGRTTTTTTTTTMTITTIQSLKARNEANQDAMNRLADLALGRNAPSSSTTTATTSSSTNTTNNSNINHNNNSSTRYILTIQKAMKSLKSCEHPITTIEEAMNLKNVGERLARVIVPTTRSKKTVGTSTTTSSTTTTTTSTAKNATETTTTSIIKNNTDKAGGATAKKTTRQGTKRTRTTAPHTSTEPAGVQPLLPSTASATTTATTTTTTSLPLSAKEQAYLQAKQEAEELILPPKGPWKIILLVDIREHKSQQVVAKCKQSGIPCEERSLPIGDMTWIAQCGEIEILVGTILERKQVDDFASSIFGTRFQEQRLRLLRSGIPQILYLVEGDLTSVQNCSAETFKMAMMETRIQSKFGILHTNHLDHTVQTLKGLHRRIIQRAFPNNEKLNILPTFASRDSMGGSSNGSGRSSRSGTGNGRNRNHTTTYPQWRQQRRPSSLLEMVFDETPIPPFGGSSNNEQNHQRFMTYQELKTKIEWDREKGTRTVGAIFGAMLKQIVSFSQKKCEGITKIYPTWNIMMEAYHGHTTKEEDEEEDCTTTTKAMTTSTLTAPTSVDGDEEKKMKGKTTTTTTRTSLPLLVKDVSIGTQRVGPKSALELDIVCCMKADGTFSSTKKGGTTKRIIRQYPEATTTTTRSILPGTMEHSTSTIPTGSNSHDVSLPTRPEVEPIQPTTLPRTFHEETTTTMWCDDSSDGGGEDDNNDTGPPTPPSTFATTINDTRNRNNVTVARGGLDPPKSLFLEWETSSDEEEVDGRLKMPSAAASLPRTTTASSIQSTTKKRPRSEYQLSLSLLSSDDDNDDDDSSCAIVEMGRPSPTKQPRRLPPVRTMTDLTCDDPIHASSTWDSSPSSSSSNNNYEDDSRKAKNAHGNSHAPDGINTERDVVGRIATKTTITTTATATSATFGWEGFSSDSSVLFSSPSTTATTTTTPRTISSSRKILPHKKGNHEGSNEIPRSIVHPKAKVGDISIVEIHDDDDEDGIEEEGTSRCSAKTLSKLPPRPPPPLLSSEMVVVVDMDDVEEVGTDRTALDSTSPGDLRSRLGRRMERETIVID